MSSFNNTWKTKTDFSRTATIGYIIDDNTIIVGDISHQKANKIFVIFTHDSSDVARHHLGRKYAWINVPNEKICAPIHHNIPPTPRVSYISRFSGYSTGSYSLTNSYYSRSYTYTPIIQRSYFKEMTRSDSKSDITPTYGPGGKKIYRTANKSISSKELLFINLKRPSFDINTQPAYYIDDDHEWIIFIKENIIYKYAVNENKYIQFPFSKKKLIKTGKGAGRIQIVIDIGNKALFMFNEYGIIKQLDLQSNKWIDHNVGDLDHSSKCIGCYIPEPFNVLYMVSNNGNHYNYHPETRTLKLLKMVGVYICSGCVQLLYCRPLKKLLLLKENLIYYLDLNVSAHEIAENVNWKKCDFSHYDKNVVCTVLYKYILFVFKEKKIYCLDLKYWNNYVSDKECDTLNLFAERNKKERFKYGLVVNDGNAHLFTKSTHIKVDLDSIIPQRLTNNYANGKYICFMIPHCPMLINGFIKQFEKNTDKIVPEALCDLIRQFYPICVL